MWLPGFHVISGGAGLTPPGPSSLRLVILPAFPALGAFFSSRGGLCVLLNSVTGDDRGCVNR